MLLQVHQDKENRLQEIKGGGQVLNTDNKLEQEHTLYLQQHQDGVGHGRFQTDDGSVSVIVNSHTHKPYPLQSQDLGGRRLPLHSKSGLKRSLGDRLVPIPHSATKFGSVSYASALKMRGQPVQKDGCVPDNDSFGEQILHSDSSQSGGLMTNEDMVDERLDETREEILQISDVLESVISSGEDGDKEEIKNGGFSSPAVIKSTISPPLRSPDQRGLLINTDIPILTSENPLSPSTQFLSSDLKTLSSPSHHSITIGTPRTPRSGVQSPHSPFNKVQDDVARKQSVKNIIDLEDVTRPSSAQGIPEAVYSGLSTSPVTHALSNSAMKLQKSPVSTYISNPGVCLPLTRSSSAPSQLPLANQLEDTESCDITSHDDDDDDDDESLDENEDAMSGNGKSTLSITANEFVPRKNVSGNYVRGSKARSRESSAISQAKSKSHKQGHFSYQQKQSHMSKQKTHTPHHKPHPSSQQQSHPQTALLNKPPISPINPLLQQWILQQIAAVMNASANSQHSHKPMTLPRFPIPGIPMPPPPPPPLSQGGQPLTNVVHPNLPLNYPPFQMNHPSRKMSVSSQEGSPHPHPHPPPPHPLPPHTTTTVQYIQGSRVTVPQVSIATRHPSERTDITGVPNLGPLPLPAHPFPTTQLHPSPTVIIPPHHMAVPPVSLYQLQSTHPPHTSSPTSHQPSHGHPLQLPHPLLVEPNNNPNTRPPLLPTPPGFTLVPRTTATSLSVTTPTSSLHPTNWPGMTGAGIRLPIPSSMSSHDQPTIVFHPRLPP